LRKKYLKGRDFSVVILEGLHNFEKVFMKLSFFVREAWNIYLEMEERSDSNMGCGWENTPSE
jgi:hypothetical protein